MSDETELRLAFLSVSCTNTKLRRRIAETDATILFYKDPEVMGGKLSREAIFVTKECRKQGKPICLIGAWFYNTGRWSQVTQDHTPDCVAEAAGKKGLASLHAVIPDELSVPGLLPWAESYLKEIFRVTDLPCRS